MSIEEKLEKLEELAALHEDIAFLYNKYRDEYEELKEFGKEKAMRDLERRLDRIIPLVERYEEKHKFFENVRRELEDAGVKFLAIFTPLSTGETAVRIKTVDELLPLSSGKLFKEKTIGDAIKRVLELEKIGKVAICRPVDYMKYECDFDDKRVILDYS